MIDPARELPATETEVEPVAPEPERRDVAAVLEPEAEASPTDATPVAAAAVFTRTLLVVDHGEEPVPDVVIEFVGETLGESGGESGGGLLLTDALGRCELRHSRGEFEVEAFKREVGLARSTVGFAPLFEGKLAKLRLVVPIEVGGVVLDQNGAPVPGAGVNVRMQGLVISEDLPFAPEPVTTDAEGRFDLNLHSNGVFVLQASHGDARSQSARVALTGGRSQELELRLMGALAIAGSVRFADGEPAAACTLRLEEDVPAGEQPFYAGGPADEQGRFRYALPHPGSYTLKVSSPHAAQLTRRITVDESAPRPELELEFESPAAIAGTVVWENGQPAGSCRVVAWLDGGRDPVEYDDLTPDNAHYWGFTLVETAEDGSFSIAPLSPGGVYSLSFQPDDEREKARVREHGILAGTEGLEVVLTEERLRGAFVFGAVSSALGEDLKDVQVQLKWREQPSEAHWGTEGARWTSETPRQNILGTGPWRSIALDGDDYRVEHLTHGRQYVLYWTAAGHGMTVMQPWIGDDAGTRADVILGAPLSLEVQVVDADGLPADRAETQLWYDGPVEPLRFYGSQYVGEEGVVVHEDVLPGVYHVSASYGGTAAEEPVEVLAGVAVTRVTLRLERP